MAEWLVADVGGSTTRVGLAAPDGLRAGTTETYDNNAYPGLAPLLADHLRAHPARVTALCAGVAGPVHGDAAQLTNRDWRVEQAALCAATGAGAVHLLNDLQARGYALDDLEGGSVAALRRGQGTRAGARLVMGLGTGSNVAVVHQVDGNLFVPPAEAGHTTLPYDPALEGLAEHVARTRPHLPYEAVLSGPGLTTLHEWRTGQRLCPSEIIAARPSGTLRLFVRLLGMVAGNLCLTHMATGGFYLIGGTARAIAPFLDEMGFEETFTAKGPYTNIMQDIPSHLITDDMAALSGCARYLRQL